MDRNLHDSQETLSFFEIQYRAIVVYLWCAFATNPNFVIQVKMNTRRNFAQSIEEEISNAGAAPHGDEVPTLEEGENADQAPVNPPPVMDENIRVVVLQLDKDITTQTQAATAHAQAMMAQANRQVVPLPNQQVATMASRLRDFTQMNPPNFYGSEVEEDPQDFIDEVYKILLPMGLCTSEKDELATSQLKEVEQTWCVHQTQEVR